MRQPLTDAQRRQLAARRRRRIRERRGSPDHVDNFPNAPPERRYSLRPLRAPPRSPSSGELSPTSVNRLLRRFIRAYGLTDDSDDDDAPAEIDARSRSIIIDAAEILVNVERIAIRSRRGLKALKLLRDCHGWTGDMYIDRQASDSDVLLLKAEEEGFHPVIF